MCHGYLHFYVITQFRASPRGDVYCIHTLVNFSFVFVLNSAGPVRLVLCFIQSVSNTT